MTRERAKNINDATVDVIKGILDGWSGKLSWELLIEAIEKRTRQAYTRQALHRHEQIHQAFNNRKKSLAEKVVNPLPENMAPELKMALERLERLKAENQRLQAENDNLLEKFARWAYNAHLKGLRGEELDKPLPNPNHDQTNGKQELKAVAKRK